MPSINSDQVEEEDSLILQSDINSIVSESTQTSYLTLPQSEPSIYQPSSQYIPHSQHLYPQSHFNSQRSTTRSVASASTQHMPAVRSTSKRRRATGSRTEIDIRTERVESLRKKVEETRQIKALEQEEERLQAELQQLES